VTADEPSDARMVPWVAIPDDASGKFRLTEVPLRIEGATMIPEAPQERLIDGRDVPPASELCSSEVAV
jgi:hypothetical protein